MDRALVDAVLVVPGDRVLEMPSFTVASGIDAGKLLLADPGDTDAISCAADTVALGLLTTHQHMGQRVPDDYAIAGFDGTYISDTAAPGLTTLGSTAGRRVEASLALLEDGSGDVVLKPELVVRGSSG
ncbi:substrate-binding domain-containing protein [Streptomyces sparsogenes]|uniref:substrate-binding domain-containing protein n=1 Tax=Streptomyces sparsogenes TaxID=67365 RepID=UPI0033ED4F26